MKAHYLAIEAGGTKWLIAIGTTEGKVLEEIEIKTSSPDVLMPQVNRIISEFESKYKNIKGLGIGTFGPIDINPSSPTYGLYLNSTKTAWTGFNVVDYIKKIIGSRYPIYLDTDVNTAVYAEYSLGAGKGKANICYVTVGTGIGGGVIMNGKILKGRLHPEIGHMNVQTSVLEPQEHFSVCNFHENCAEGKASGVAMAKRWNASPDEMPPLAWKIEAEYLGQLAMNITAAYSPDCIIFGGGVMQNNSILSLIREAFKVHVNEYWSLPPLDSYIVKSKLENRAGLIGALLLAKQEPSS